MAVVTMTPIMKGEEITVNYFFTIADERGEFCLTRESRRRKINELFNFDCLCSECSQVEFRYAKSLLLSISISRGRRMTK